MADVLDAREAPLTIGAALGRFRWRITLTYTLTFLENIFELLYPFMVGVAIDGLIDGNWLSLLPIIITWLIHSLLAFARQVYDARIFARMYQQLAANVVAHQLDRGVSTSYLAARSGLMREFVDFLEEDIPYVITVVVNFLGAVILLFLFDAVVGLYCLFVLFPLSAVNLLHRRATRDLNRSLNDQLEDEVEVIESHQPSAINAHFGQVARWYIRLSDADARTWLVMQPLLIGLIVLALVRSVGMNMEAGDIFATLAYALTFTDSLDEVPVLVQQYSSLQDIAERVNTPEEA